MASTLPPEPASGTYIVRACAILVALGLLLAACDHVVPLNPPITAPPLAARIHDTIGVFYPEELRGYRCKASKGYIADTFDFDLGPPSVAMFDTVLAGLFDHVAHVDGAPHRAGLDGAHPMVSFQLIEFTGCEARWPIVGTTVIDIAYEAVISSRTGTQIARIIARGHADRFDLPNEEQGDEAGHLSRLTAAAMRRAAADFVFEFERHTEIRKALDAESAHQP